MSNHHRFAAAIVFTLAPSLAAFAEPTSAISTERGTIRVPDGFTIERVAAAPLIKHPMLANFDERGRLFIAASAGKNLRTAERTNRTHKLDDDQIDSFKYNRLDLTSIL